MDNKKGVTKFWIEIIGGVVIVVIILVIFIYAGTKVSSLVEDVSARNSFDILTETMTQAVASGTQAASPWKLSTGRQNGVYAIVRMSQDFALNVTNQGPGLNTGDQYVISQCNIPSDPQDACLCLLSINYKEGIHAPPFSVIAVDSSSGISDDGYLAEKDKWIKWEGDFPFNAINDMHVLKCINIKSMCSWTNSNGTVWPCYLHYKGQSVVWMGANTEHGFDFEVLKIDKGQGYVMNINPTIAQGSGNPTTAMYCEPCKLQMAAAYICPAGHHNARGTPYADLGGSFEYKCDSDAHW